MTNRESPEKIKETVEQVLEIMLKQVSSADLEEFIEKNTEYNLYDFYKYLDEFVYDNAARFFPDALKTLNKMS